mmetsp:Transcript_11701/g.15886  ORF Transcript_11701/g.15886 Transcript_11701/m.15886 type:complete len:220 (+) Transcript_11701:17-676(+)
MINQGAITGLIKQEEMVGVEQIDAQAGALLKDEEAHAQLMEQKEMIAKDASKNPYLAKFTQLWFACYFERRLTRQVVEGTDLVSIVQDLTKYFASEGTKINFRRALPLLQGLHVLFSRKMAFTMRDSERVLKSMSEPSETIQLNQNGEGQDPLSKATKTKRKAQKDGAHPARAANNVALELNPNNFDWFLSGIDQSRLENILGGASGANVGSLVDRQLA